MSDRARFGIIGRYAAIFFLTDRTEKQVDVNAYDSIEDAEADAKDSIEDGEAYEVVILKVCRRCVPLLGVETK